MDLRIGMIGMMLSGARGFDWRVGGARGRVVGLVAATAGLLGLWTVAPAGSAAAATSQLRLFRDTGHITITGGGTPIAVGPDGALWFADENGQTAFSIGRITTTGVITHYTDPRFVPLGFVQIAAGPDNTLWFTITGSFPSPSIGRITTSGGITIFPDPGAVDLGGIAEGPDGAMWVRAAGKIQRITPTGVITTFSDPRIFSLGGIAGIARGPDGAMWFTNNSEGDSVASPDSIGRITTSGAITTYTAPIVFRPGAIGAVRDGALWFGSSTEVGVWRITTPGAITKYNGPSDINLYGESFAAGPDGATWYATGGDKIGRVTSFGVITAYTLPAGSTNASGIVVGPDNALWFTLSAPSGAGEIGRLSLQPTFSGPGRVKSGTLATLRGVAPHGAIVTIKEALPGKPFKAIGHALASKTTGAFTFRAKVTRTGRFKAVVGQVTSKIIVIRT